MLPAPAMTHSNTYDSDWVWVQEHERRGIVHQVLPTTRFESAETCSYALFSPSAVFAASSLKTYR